MAEKLRKIRKSYDYRFPGAYSFDTLSLALRSEVASGGRTAVTIGLSLQNPPCLNTKTCATRNTAATRTT